MAEGKKREAKAALPFILMAGLFVVIDVLALLIANPFDAAGLQAFPNPNDPLNLVYVFSMLLVVTLVFLLIAKFANGRLLQGIILGATAFLAFYIFSFLLSFALPAIWAIILPVAIVALMVVLLIKYPEWYVLDLYEIVLGVGAAAMLGISLGITLIIILLSGLAIYDAIAVYKTKHMIDLADAAIGLKLPVMFVIPKTRGFSLLKGGKSLKQKLQEGEEREAFFMGLGDVVMPGILVVASYYNLTSGNLPVALSVMLGTLLGFAVLSGLVIKGKPQAGLPCLCGGAIAGYLVSSLLLFGWLH
jgi:presenilin-like A22 family membrane protease